MTSLGTYSSYEVYVPNDDLLYLVELVEQLLLRVDTHLAVDVRDVGLDGGLAHVELFGDVFDIAAFYEVG